MDGRVGIEGLLVDLEKQRAVVAERTPVYDRVLVELRELLREDPALAARVSEALSGREFYAAYDRPLLILGALRFAALRGGTGHPLHRALAAAEPDVAAVERAAIAEVLGEPATLESIAGRRVQTNETLRAVAWRWPAALAGCSHGARPLVLIDVGASAGLNLVADALPAPWVEESGAPIEVAEAVRTPARVGLDLQPLDARQPDDADWLRACVWPGDAGRLERLEAALQAFRDSDWLVERADVLEGLARIRQLAEQAPADAFVLVYQTVVRDYLPPDVQRAWQSSMEALIAARPAGTIAWVELEGAPGPVDAAFPAALTAHLRGPAGVERLELARTFWHPKVLRIDAAARERFVELAEVQRGQG